MSVSERDKIIQRIKKLKAHAESAAQLGSLEEAKAFTEKLEELMIEYNLSMTDVDSAKEATKDEFHNWVYTESISYHESATDYRWRLQLVRVLCKYNFCSFTFNKPNRTFKLYGNADNIDTIVWLYHYLTIGLLRLAQSEFRKKDKIYQKQYGKYQFLKDFLYGAADGIDSKLDEQRRQHAQANSLNALVKVNNDALIRFQKQRIPNVKSAKIQEIKIGPEYFNGLKAGKNFSIGKPLETNTKPENKKLS